jgi:hypothetical protein
MILDKTSFVIELGVGSSFSGSLELANLLSPHTHCTIYSISHWENVHSISTSTGIVVQQRKAAERLDDGSLLM